MGRCLPSRHARSLSLAITSVNSVLTALIAVLSLTFAWVRGGLRLETYTHTQDEKTESREVCQVLPFGTADMECCVDPATTG